MISQYHDSGQLILRAEEDAGGQFHGLCQRFDEFGELIEESHWTHGKPDGERRQATPWGVKITAYRDGAKVEASVEPIKETTK